MAHKVLNHVIKRLAEQPGLEMTCSKIAKPDRFTYRLQVKDNTLIYFKVVTPFKGECMYLILVQNYNFKAVNSLKYSLSYIPLILVWRGAKLSVNQG